MGDNWASFIHKITFKADWISGALSTLSVEVNLSLYRPCLRKLQGKTPTDGRALLGILKFSMIGIHFYWTAGFVPIMVSIYK